MEIKKFFTRMLTETSVFFTVISALFALFLLIFNAGDQEIVMSAERLLLNFMFAWVASLAQAVFRMESVPRVGRTLLRFFILAFAFYICFLLPASMTSAQVLIGLVLFTLIYAAVMGVCTLFLSRFRANAKPEEAYESQFKKRP